MSNLKGIQVLDEELMITQFVDDTTIFSKYEASTLQAAIDIFHKFYENTGLKENFWQKCHLQDWC